MKTKKKKSTVGTRWESTLGRKLSLYMVLPQNHQRALKANSKASVDFKDT